MGIDISFYVGAFVEFPTVSIKESLKIVRCSNFRCKNHKQFSGQSKFCPDCGSAIDNVVGTQQVNRPLELEDLNNLPDNTTQWHDELSSTNDMDVYTSNKRGKTGFNIWQHDRPCIHIITPQSMEEMKKAFTKQLEELNFFKIVEENFGVVIEVQLGSFSSWN